MVRSSLFDERKKAVVPRHTGYLLNRQGILYVTDLIQDVFLETSGMFLSHCKNVYIKYTSRISNYSSSHPWKLHLHKLLAFQGSSQFQMTTRKLLSTVSDMIQYISYVNIYFYFNISSKVVSFRGSGRHILLSLDRARLAVSPFSVVVLR